MDRAATVSRMRMANKICSRCMSNAPSIKSLVGGYNNAVQKRIQKEHDWAGYLVAIEKGDLLRAILPVYPLDVMGLEVDVYRFADRREEVLLAELHEELKALQLVFDRILHLGEAQLDACRVQGVVELADDIGSGHVDAGDRLGRNHQPTHWCRGARYRVQDAIVEQLGIGEE